VEIIKVVPAAEAPRNNDDEWKQALAELHLTEVNMPPDGHCFFASCYSVTTGVCPSRLGASRHIATTRAEATYYRQGCYETLLEHYDTHVGTGLLDEDDMRHRLPGPALAEADVRARIHEYLRNARDLVATAPAGLAYWAGETEERLRRTGSASRC
jgi:hypothetical protein